MEINWFIIGGIVFLAVILVIFLVKRNLRDKKKLEVFLDKNSNNFNKDESEFNDEESNH